MKKFSSLCLVITAVVGSVSSVSPVSCSNYNTACEEDAEDLLDITTGVLSQEVCRQICLDSTDCNYFTYYDVHSSPLRQACLTFATCLTVTECSDCVSENKYCETCGAATSGIIDQNLLDFRLTVESELECKAGCISTSNCSYYTYFTQEDSQFPGLCFLLTDLISPLTDCPHCLSGPLDCSQARPPCQLEYQAGTKIETYELRFWFSGQPR